MMPLPNTAPITAKGPPGFLMWLQRAHPQVYRHIRSTAPHLITQGALHGLHGLGQDLIDTSAPIQDISAPTADWTPAGPSSDTSTGSTGSWADAIASLATPLITGVEQVKLFNTQLSLAQQGRPPLNTSQIRLPGVPVNVSLAAGGNTWLIAGGLGVLALILFGRRRA